jgi:hypothetical protein
MIYSDRFFKRERGKFQVTTSFAEGIKSIAVFVIFILSDKLIQVLVVIPAKSIATKRTFSSVSAKNE